MCEDVMLERLLMPRSVSYSSYMFPLLIAVCRKKWSEVSKFVGCQVDFTDGVLFMI